jgi:peroxiredoxin
MRVWSAFAVVLLTAACTGDSSEPAEEPFEWPDYLSPLPPEYVLGQEAPDFELPTLATTGIGEDTVRLTDLRGKVVVLNFWNTGCVPCVAEHQTLNSIAETYEPDGLQYLGIDDLDTPESLAAFEAQHGPSSFPQLADPGNQVGASYNRTGWPLHVVIDREGRVAWWRRGGPIKEETLHEVIGTVLEGRRPQSPTSASFPDEVGR